MIWTLPVSPASHHPALPLAYPVPTPSFSFLISSALFYFKLLVLFYSLLLEHPFLVCVCVWCVCVCVWFCGPHTRVTWLGCFILSPVLVGVFANFALVEIQEQEN